MLLCNSTEELSNSNTNPVKLPSDYAFLQIQGTLLHAGIVNL